MPFAGLANFINAVKTAEPKFDRFNSSLRGLIGELERNVVVPAKVQRELDSISVKYARKYVNALKIVVTGVPNVCYTGVEGVKAYWVSGKEGRVNATFHWPKHNIHTLNYSSKEFKFDAKVYCISAPHSGFEIGYVQYCRSMRNKVKYEDGSALKYGNNVPFPVGDCSDPNDQPWYFKSAVQPATNCDAVSRSWWELNNDTGTTRDVQMTDGFDGNYFPARAVNAAGVEQAGVNYTDFTREQDFSCWLVRRGPGAERLFFNCDYSIGIQISKSHKKLSTFHVGGESANSLTCRIVGPFPNNASDSRSPNVLAVWGMNNTQFWSRKTVNSNTWAAFSPLWGN
jgi:hypothetical protein